MAAFLIADGLAIIFGDMIIRFFPIFYIKLIAGIAFLIIGLFMLCQDFVLSMLRNLGFPTFSRDEEEISCSLKTPFMSAFGLILVSEIGDKTQITAGLFATKYNALFVFFGVMLALFLLSLMAVFLGNILFKKVKKNIVSNIAGTLFVAIGVFTLIGLN